MKRSLQRLIPLIQVAALRLWSNRGLAACAVIGITATVALTVSIPIYADSVNHRLLQEQLELEERPPFAFLFWYVGAWNGSEDWENVAPLDTYMSVDLAADIDLPVQQAVRHFRTPRLRMFSTQEGAYSDEDDELEWVVLGMLSGLEEKARILEGSFPSPGISSDGLIEVLVTLSLADRLGLQVGEEYVVFAPPSARGMPDGFERTVRIVGVWEMAEENDEYWIHRYSAFETILLTSNETFLEDIVPTARRGIELAEWYFVFDGRDVHVENTLPLLSRIQTIETQVTTLLRYAELAESPANAILRYYQNVQYHTILLYTFGTPVLVLLFYFVAQVWGMIVDRQRGEIASLRSRGTTVRQIVGIYLLEGLVVGLLAVAIGLLIGNSLARAMGRSTSFLELGRTSPFDTRLSWGTLRYGVLALCVSLGASLVPVVASASHTIVSHKREQARTMERPVWQRFFIDIGLLIPALYGYYLLRVRGTISVLGRGSGASSPFENPLLFLVPILFIFASALILLRLVPVIMRWLAWAAGRFRGAVPVLALRDLARAPAQTTSLLLLLVISPGLAIFTASMASTLDAQLVDQVYYDIGADFRLTELGQSTEEQTDDRPSYSFSPEEQPTDPTEYFFLPVTDYLLIPGVQQVSRVGDYRMTDLQRNVNIHLLGVDRATLPSVTRFRSDYASESLGALMNYLALQWDGLLIDRRAAAAYNLQVGDQLQARINVGTRPESSFTIVGFLDYFPTSYPEDGLFAVANLDYVFEQLGGRYPYDVWLVTEESVTSEDIWNGLLEIGFNIISVDDSRALVEETQLQPERQGFFGLLSVGFLTTAALTVLGFLLHSYVSFQRRFVHFGMLRALGLSVQQMGLLLAGEQLALIATGLAGGTVVGLTASRLFIPYLQVRAGHHPLTPPYIVQVAWGDVAIVYAIFAVMFFAAAGVLLSLLRRMRIFEAVKLGEAI